jgi:hypothetical protein
MNTIVVILAVAVLIALVVVIPVFGSGFGKKGHVQKRGNATSLDKRFVQGKWLEIESTFSLGGASHLKNAIMDADKLVDHVLKSKGLPGQTMGERMKAAKKYFAHYADYDNLWFAHKVRNNIAHEAGHDLNTGEAKRAIEYFRKALKTLGAL